MNEINKKIKDLRFKLGLTQIQFAELIGLSQPNLSALEAGKRDVNINVLMKLKEEFDFDMNDFLNKDISEIDIFSKKMPKEITDELWESEVRFRTGKHKDKHEKVAFEHRQFTARFLRSNKLDDVDDDIFTFGLTSGTCSSVRKYCLKEQTLDSFALFKEGLMTKEELLAKYKEAIEIETKIYEIIKPYEKAVEELSEKLSEIMYGDLKIQ